MGVTETVPEVASTLPTRLMVAEVALTTTQVRVEHLPGAMDEADAEKCGMLTGPEWRVTVVVAEACNLSVFFTVKRKL